MVNFTGLEAEKLFDPSRPYGALTYQLKATRASQSLLIAADFRMRGGMPLSRVRDVDVSKEHKRYSELLPVRVVFKDSLLSELEARFTVDFTPYGDGLSGQADFKDATGHLHAYIQILKVAKVRKTCFRNGGRVVMKGTFKQYCKSSGVHN